MFVVRVSFKSLIKDNNFAVWINRERGGSGKRKWQRAVFLSHSAGTVLTHFEKMMFPP